MSHGDSYECAYLYLVTHSLSCSVRLGDTPVLLPVDEGRIVRMGPELGKLFDLLLSIFLRLF